MWPTAVLHDKSRSILPLEFGYMLIRPKALYAPTVPQIL